MNALHTSHIRSSHPPTSCRTIWFGRGENPRERVPALAAVSQERLLQAVRSAACLAIILGLAGCGRGGRQSSSTGGTAGSLSSGASADMYTVTFRALDEATGTLAAQTYLTFTVL